MITGKEKNIIRGKRILRSILALLVTVAVLATTYASGAVFAQADFVWAYHAGSSTPYAKYATVREAYSDAAFADGDVFEFHGDVVETVTEQIEFKNNVTIISEDGVSHKWSFPDVQTNYGVCVCAANKTLTVGGENGDGVLTVDNGGVCGFANVTEGALVINDLVEIRNCVTSGADGGPILVMKCGDLDTPVLRINGGTFVNNKSMNALSSRDGGLITNLGGKVYLNGGTFSGNEAPTGKGNAIYNSGELHIDGTTVFDENQDIYIVCENDALNFTDDEHAIVKDGEIGSGLIPVTIGTKISALYEGRNILVSGTVDVTSDDAAVFNVLNGDDLNAYYKKPGYTERDGGEGNPVIELVPEFAANMGNFVDDNYKIPTLPDPVRTKTARWLDEKKSQAEIIISENSNKVEGPILVLGTLCAAHFLTGDTIATAINTLAKYNDVEYYFQSVTCAGPSQFAQRVEGSVCGPVQGSVAKGGNISGNIFGDPKNDGALYPGAHNSGGCTAQKLKQALQEKQYSNIVLFFDNFSINTYSYYAYTPEEQVAFYQAANLLKPYYEKNQVIWISAARHIIGIDYDTQTSVTQELMKTLLGRGCYSDNESHYHYDETHTVNDASSIGRFDKFNNFFNMALFDPATWLGGVNENKIPAWDDYDVDNPGVLYANASQVEDYVNAWINRDEIKITDTVDSALPVNHVVIEVSNDGSTWTNITENAGVSIKVVGQVVECSITDDSYFYTNLRMRIICDCPGEFRTEGYEPKDTNIGKATVNYYYEGTLNESHPLVSPELYKAFPTATVTKEFAGLTSDQIKALSDDFCITILNEDTEKIVAKLSLLAEPEEGMIPPDIVSEDGMQFTWKVILTDGEYTISEGGADLSGYTMKPEGLGAVAVDTSNNDENTIKITNTFTVEPDLPPETGDISVIYLGIALIALSGILLTAFVGRGKKIKDIR